MNGYGASSNQPRKDYRTKSFIRATFSSAERAAILTTTVVNDDNAEHFTSGGNGTKDKVFLLSEAEVYDATHGFGTSAALDQRRECKLSDYGHAMGAWSGQSSSSGSSGICLWWLRSPGANASYVCNVDASGFVDCFGGLVVAPYATRPALNLNLASASVQPAGIVSSDGDVDESAATGNPFVDVTDDTSHHDEILWLAESGISTGWDTPSRKEFRPNDNVKRGDMAAFLFRLDGIG